MTQEQAILRHLRKGKTLTALEALALCGSYRLAARVHQLRQDGHNIKAKRRISYGGARVAEYYLDSSRAL